MEKILDLNPRQEWILEKVGKVGGEYGGYYIQMMPPYVKALVPLYRGTRAFILMHLLTELVVRIQMQFGLFRLTLVFILLLDRGEYYTITNPATGKILINATKDNLTVQGMCKSCLLC